MVGVAATHQKSVTHILGFLTIPDEGTTRLDLRIHRPGPHMPLAIDIYDRRSEPQFADRLTPFRLPHPDSMLWVSIGRNVLEAQMIRFSRLCTYAGYFAHRTAVCIRDMLTVQ